MLLLSAPEGARTDEAPPTRPHSKDRLLFEKEVAPILARCQPCHFPKGVMYDKLPFDDPGTVHRLGERLFSRIKDEKERDVLRRYLAASHASP